MQLHRRCRTWGGRPLPSRAAPSHMHWARHRNLPRPARPPPRVDGPAWICRPNENGDGDGGGGGAAPDTPEAVHRTSAPIRMRHLHRDRRAAAHKSGEVHTPSAARHRPAAVRSRRAVPNRPAASDKLAPPDTQERSTPNPCRVGRRSKRPRRRRSPRPALRRRVRQPRCRRPPRRLRRPRRRRPVRRGHAHRTHRSRSRLRRRRLPRRLLVVPATVMVPVTVMMPVMAVMPMMAMMPVMMCPLCAVMWAGSVVTGCVRNRRDVRDRRPVGHRRWDHMAVAVVDRRRRVHRCWRDIDRRPAVVAMPVGWAGRMHRRGMRVVPGAERGARSRTDHPAHDRPLAPTDMAAHGGTDAPTDRSTQRAARVRLRADTEHYARRHHGHCRPLLDRRHGLPLVHVHCDPTHEPRLACTRTGPELFPFVS